jgi:hypothetical protein
MFSLKKHAAQISNVNTRIERHGDERKLAVDVSFALKVGSDQIDPLSTGLRESLFRAPGSGDQISLLNANAMTAVRHPSLKPVQLTHKFPGYEMSIAPLDANEDDDGEFFVDVELKGFTVEAHEGGSCSVTFKAGMNVDTSEAKAVLDALIREDALLSLVPPKAQAQHDEDLGADEGEDEGENEGLPAAA